jgi:hypothetical protein
MKKILMALIFIGSVFQAHATIISTSVGDYNIETILCTFNDTVCQEILDDQVWWGNSTLAEEFSDEVGSFFGSINPFPSTLFTVYFAFGASSTSSGLASGCELALGCHDNLTSAVNDRYWATATQVSVPEPSTVSLILVILSGLIFVRRKRIL